jgi:predicted regulator of Ras-like GTPase activity (Roadblock/LC7/MglB family)
MISAAFQSACAALTRHRGVQGCMVVHEADGIVVEAAVRYGVETGAVAALVASLYRKARLSSRRAMLGDVLFLRLEAERGFACAAGRGGLVLVTLADASANIGLIRVQMLREVATLAADGGTGPVLAAALEGA